LQLSINQRIKELSRVDGVSPDLIEKFRKNRPKTAPSKNQVMATLEESFDQAVKIKDAFDFSHLNVGDGVKMQKRKREDVSPNRRPNSLLELEINPIETSVLYYANRHMADIK